MSKLNIKLRVSPITQLAQDSNGKYNFVVDINKVDGSPINSDKVPNSTLISADAFIEDSVSKILLPIDIADGDYSMNVSIDVFSQDRGVLLANLVGYFLSVGETSTDPGNAVFKLITKGMDEHMKLISRTEGDIDFWTDLTANSIGDLYEYIYIINAQVVRQSTPLKDYPVARNNGFRIVKANIKKSIYSLNQWGQNPADDGYYYDHTAGQSFDYNVSYAEVSAIYGGSQSGFLNPVPATFDPSLQMPQWADITPDIKLPEGHVFILSRGDWDMDQVRRKGITHISHFQIPRPNGDETLSLQMRQAGETYSDVPTSFMLFGYIPVNPSDEEVDRLLERHQLPHAIEIWETMEQAHAIPPDSGWLKRFNEGFAKLQKKNFLDKGINALFCYNYFQFWPSDYHLGQVSAERSKLNFRTPLDQLQRTNFSPGGSLSDTTLIVEAVYLAAPDIQQNGILDHAYKLALFNYMGYESGTFLASEHENRPNNVFEYIYPEGKFYTKYKIPLDPNALIAYTYFSQTWGKVFVQWGGTGKNNAGKIFNDLTPEPTYFKPNGSNEYKVSSRSPIIDEDPYNDWITSPDFPYAKRGGVGYYGYNAGTDLPRFALQLWADTWGLLEGGERNFLSFRIDGGDWINAVNEFMDDVVDANTYKRGFVYSIQKDGRISWFYVDPFADNLWKQLEVKFPNGRIVKNRVSGNGLHAKIESL